MSPSLAELRDASCHQIRKNISILSPSNTMTECECLIWKYEQVSQVKGPKTTQKMNFKLHKRTQKQHKGCFENFGHVKDVQKGNTLVAHVLLLIKDSQFFSDCHQHGKITLSYSYFNWYNVCYGHLWRRLNSSSSFYRVTQVLCTILTKKEFFLLKFAVFNRFKPF